MLYRPAGGEQHEAIQWRYACAIAAALLLNAEIEGLK